MIIHPIRQPFEQIERDIKYVNTVLGAPFTKVLGGAWELVTKPDGNTELHLTSLMPQKTIPRYTEKLTRGKIRNFTFSQQVGGMYLLTISQPINVPSFYSPFAHMSLKILMMPLKKRVGARVLLLGPELTTSKNYGTTQHPAVYCPKLLELHLLFPQAQITVMDKEGSVLDSLKKLREHKIIYPVDFLKTLTVEERKKLDNGISKHRFIDSFRFFWGDITKRPLEVRFEIIVALRVLRFIPHQHGVETVDEGKKLALKTLLHLFLALSSGGKLYIDEESINLLLAISGMDYVEFFDELRIALQVSAISHELIFYPDALGANILEFQLKH